MDAKITWINKHATTCPWYTPKGPNSSSCCPAITTSSCKLSSQERQPEFLGSAPVHTASNLYSELSCTQHLLFSREQQSLPVEDNDGKIIFSPSVLLQLLAVHHPEQPSSDDLGKVSLLIPLPLSRQVVCSTVLPATQLSCPCKGAYPLLCLPWYFNTQTFAYSYHITYWILFC